MLGGRAAVATRIALRLWFCFFSLPVLALALSVCVSSDRLSFFCGSFPTANVFHRRPAHPLRSGSAPSHLARLMLSLSLCQCVGERESVCVWARRGLGEGRPPKHPGICLVAGKSKRDSLD